MYIIYDTCICLYTHIIVYGIQQVGMEREQNSRAFHAVYRARGGEGGHMQGERGAEGHSRTRFYHGHGKFNQNDSSSRVPYLSSHARGEQRGTAAHDCGGVPCTRAAVRAGHGFELVEEGRSRCASFGVWCCMELYAQLCAQLFAQATACVQLRT